MTAPAVVARRAALQAPVHQSALDLAALTAPLPCKRRPKVAQAGELIRVGDQLLDQAEAVRLWSELGDALGLAERGRRPRAWGWLAEWLDDAFKVAAQIEVRDRGARVQAAAIRLDEARAMVRLAPFEVAHLRRLRSSSRTWTGPVAVYSPGPLGVGPLSPDATLAFTSRTVRAGTREIETAPVVGP